MALLSGVNQFMQDDIIHQFRWKQYQLDVEADVIFHRAASPSGPLTPDCDPVVSEAVLCGQLRQPASQDTPVFSRIHIRRELRDGFGLALTQADNSQVFQNPGLFPVYKIQSVPERCPVGDSYPDFCGRQNGDAHTPGPLAVSEKNRAYAVDIDGTDFHSCYRVLPAPFPDES